MREDQHKFLMLHGQSPARLTVEQVAFILNCQMHDVPVLVAARLLKPLGTPPPNAVKYFASTEIAELARDRAWLSRVTQALNLHWRNQNLRKKNRAAHVAQRGDSPLPLSPAA